MPQKDRQLIEVLARGFAVLECLSRARKPLGNGDIAALVDLPPSTVSRLTHSLTVLGYIRRSASRRTYELTPKNLLLGYPVLAGMSLVEHARPYLKTISDQTGETVTLAVRDGLFVTFVEVAPGNNIVAVRLSTGARLRMAVSAAGIALISALPEKEQRILATQVRDDILQRGEKIKGFDEALAACSRDGYALVRNSWQKGIGGVSVSICFQGERGALTMPVATGSVSESTMRNTLADALLTAAKGIGPGLS